MKTIAWNVDTQYDFMRPDGKLYGKDAETIEPTLEKLTNKLRMSGMIIVNTADYHTPEDEEVSGTPDFKDRFPQHCMRGTLGAEYVPATRPNAPYKIDWQDKSFDLERLTNSREIVIYKKKLDVFSGNPHTENILNALAPDRAIVYGIFTEFCLNYAVTGLVDRGIEVYVVEDAIKDLVNGEATIQDWKKIGVKTIRSDELR
jgi:nicotinamidase/pyrazinamidase